MNLRTLLTLSVLAAGSLTAIHADDGTTVPEPEEWYIYKLNDAGDEIEGSFISLGDAVKRTNDVFASNVITLSAGAKFVIASDATATSLATMEGRRYPAQTDAVMDMFEQMEISETAVDGCPEYFTAPSDGTGRFMAYLARTDYDWNTQEYTHKSIQLDPANLMLNVRQRGSSDAFTTSEAEVADGYYFLPFTPEETANYEFAFSYQTANGGTKYCVSTVTQDDQRTITELDKAQAGRTFTLSDTSSPLFFVGPELTAHQPYRFVLDINSNFGQWTSTPVYVNHWISGTMKNQIFLHADVANAQGGKVEVQGHYNYYVVSPDGGTTTKTVGAYRFDLIYDLVTATTQNIFYFDVMNAKDPTRKLFSLVSNTGTEQAIIPEYANGKICTTYEDNGGRQFYYTGFDTNTKYSFFIEPATGKVWMQANASVLTGIEPAVADMDDAAAPVEWYDLQGRRVPAPSHGLYIRRQGARAAKVAL